MLRTSSKVTNLSWVTNFLEVTTLEISFSSSGVIKRAYARGVYIKDVSAYAGDVYTKGTCVRDNCSKCVCIRHTYIKTFYSKVTYIKDTSVKDTYSWGTYIGNISARRAYNGSVYIKSVFIRVVCIKNNSAGSFCIVKH